MSSGVLSRRLFLWAVVVSGLRVGYSPSYFAAGLGRPSKTTVAISHQDQLDLPENKEFQVKILVTGGTGRVGSEVIQELITRGATVRALVRSTAAAEKLPKQAEPALGDMLDPERGRRKFKRST